MASYSGAKCISCSEAFKDGDDVVVCPECGTPYHRECYLREGKCINEKLHESGQSWQHEERDKDSVNTRCIRCGFENTPDKLFCEKCGTPLMKSDAETERPFNDVGPQTNYNDHGAAEQFNRQGDPRYNPFGRQMVFDKDSDLDGIRLDDYAKYVKSNPLVFLSNFIRFGKFGGKLSLNFSAFVFPHLYFLFRKMNLVGIIMLVVTGLLNIPTAIEYLASGTLGYTVNIGVDVESTLFQGISSASWYVSMALQFVAGFFANYIYYKTAQKNIREIRSQDIADEEEIARQISAKGGTSWAAVILGFFIYSAIVVGGVFGISKIMG